MGSKIEYIDSTHIYATNYVRNSKAIGVLWGIFTICYAIIIIVAFVTPEWFGDTIQSEYPARFGIWKICYFGNNNIINSNNNNNNNNIGILEDCQGRLDDLSTIINLPFKITTILYAVSIIIAILTILFMLLFLFFTSTTIFKICAWLQIISGICLVGGVAVYPAGWDSDIVRRTCGQTAGKYVMADCSLRWSFLLAVIGCLDAFILATLAFILATRHVKLQPEPTYTTNGSLYKGEVNGGFMGDAHSMAGSRKSLNLHPVLLMPQPGEMDCYSEFSNRTGRSKSSAFRNDYSSSMHNFQL